MDACSELVGKRQMNASHPQRYTTQYGGTQRRTALRGRLVVRGAAFEIDRRDLSGVSGSRGL